MTAATQRLNSDGEIVWTFLTERATGFPAGGLNVADTPDLFGKQAEYRRSWTDETQPRLNGRN